MLRVLLKGTNQSVHWTLPLIQSIAAFIACLAIVLVWMLPEELHRRNSRFKGNLSFGMIVPGTKMFVAAIQQSGNDSLANSVSFARVSLEDDAHVTSKSSPFSDVRCATIDPLGRRLFLGCSDSSLVFTDAARPLKSTMLLGHILKGYPLRMMCTPDCRKLVIQDAYGLYGWDIDDQGDMPGIPAWCRLNSDIDAITLRSNSVTGIKSRYYGPRTEIVEFDLCTGMDLALLTHCEGRIRSLALSTNDRYIIGVDGAGKLIQFDQNSHDERTKHFGDANLLITPELPPTFSPSGAFLATCDTNARDLFVWNMESQRMICIFAHPRGCKLLGFGFLNEEEILSWGTDNTLRLWRLSESNPVQSLEL